MKVKKKFAEVNRPLTKEEEKALRESIEEVGVLEPIVVWNDDIIDGHNRRRIANKLGTPDDSLPQLSMDFESDEEAIEWAIRKQLGRRNLTHQDFMVALGKLYNFHKRPEGRPEKNSDTVAEFSSPAEELAEEHDVSPRTVERAGKIQEAHEKLTKPAQQLYAAGKLEDKYVPALAKKPADKQAEIARQIRTGQKKAADIFGTKKDNGKPKTKTKGPADKVRAFILKIDEVRKGIDDVRPLLKSKSQDWQIALDKSDEARKALVRLAK